MSFIETAAAFDKARRDAFEKKEIRISVDHSVQHFVAIPSIRWPWHFTATDHTGKPLSGVKIKIFDSSGKIVFVSQSSRRGTASGMIELGTWASLHVTKKADNVSGAKSVAQKKMSMLMNTSNQKNKQNDTAVQEYLPFEMSLQDVERKRSPLMVKITMCPKPLPQSARAILSWSHAAGLISMSVLHLWQQVEVGMQFVFGGSARQGVGLR